MLEKWPTRGIFWCWNALLIPRIVSDGWITDVLIPWNNFVSSLICCLSVRMQLLRYLSCLNVLLTNWFRLAQIFPGNYDRFMVVTNRFLRPIKARYFRIHPVTWRSWISMRVEFFGCIVGKRLPYMEFSAAIGAESNLPKVWYVKSLYFSSFVSLLIS